MEYDFRVSSSPGSLPSGLVPCTTSGSLYRPAGLMIVVEVIKTLIDAGYKLEDVVQAIAKIPMQLANEPWAGLLWDVTNRRMIMSADNRILAERLLAYGLTSDEDIAGRTARELRKEWAGILVKGIRSVALPSWVRLKIPRKVS